jgi:hypothetical protein
MPYQLQLCNSFPPGPPPPPQGNGGGGDQAAGGGSSGDQAFSAAAIQESVRTSVGKAMQEALQASSGADGANLKAAIKRLGESEDVKRKAADAVGDDAAVTESLKRMREDQSSIADALGAITDRLTSIESGAKKDGSSGRGPTPPPPKRGSGKSGRGPGGAGGGAGAGGSRLTVELESSEDESPAENSVQAFIGGTNWDTVVISRDFHCAFCTWLRIGIGAPQAAAVLAGDNKPMLEGKTAWLSLPAFKADGAGTLSFKDWWNEMKNAKNMARWRGSLEKFGFSLVAALNDNLVQSLDDMSDVGKVMVMTAVRGKIAFTSGGGPS